MTRAVNERMVKSFLDLFVLSLLDNGGKHGYEIMRELKVKTGAHIGAGTLYPLQYELEEPRLVCWLKKSAERIIIVIILITKLRQSVSVKIFLGSNKRMKFSNLNHNLDPDILLDCSI